MGYTYYPKIKKSNSMYGRIKNNLFLENCTKSEYIFMDNKDINQSEKENNAKRIIDIYKKMKLFDRENTNLLGENLIKIPKNAFLYNEGKIKPRCSSAAILDWGEETDAKKYLEEKEFGK